MPNGSNRVKTDNLSNKTSKNINPVVCVTRKRDHHEYLYLNQVAPVLQFHFHFPLFHRHQAFLVDLEQIALVMILVNKLLYE